MKTARSNKNRSAAPAQVESERATLAAAATVDRYRRIRGFTQQLCETLEPEDCVVQSMADASPVRWHLAHTTWFFETFVLTEFVANYRPFAEPYVFLFNSYYNALGEQFPRAKRGLLSRPTLAQVWEYRNEIDRRLLEALHAGTLQPLDKALSLIELGLEHEQQHQELILTDIKHALATNPLMPVFRPDPMEREVSAGRNGREVRGGREVRSGEGDDAHAHQQSPQAKRLAYVRDPGGMTRIGHDAENGFAYDNETPAHSAYLGAFRLANRAATSGEYLQFIDDGGYRRPELWLSEGWSKVTSENWAGPLYWVQHEGYWYEFTLAGLQRLDLSRPVCHISYFEADAFARWAGARLPTEFEWEHVATKVAVGADGQETRSRVFADQLIDDGVALHPQRVDPASADFGDMLGNVWEWTSSAYAAYPGYRPSPGAIGEYNGKFMCNQYVLRGGSCATSSDHIRVTYRNFFPAHARWQFTGVRCAQDD